jgi:DNA-binding GntR family transcriptional regulator
MARRAATARMEPEVEAANASLTDRAYRLIETLIVTLQLAPGARVSEALLSARLGIGRTPVREALLRLARERLIVIAPRRGIFVAPIDVDAQLRMNQVRREVERLIARSAAERASLAERAQMKILGVALRQAADRHDGPAFDVLDAQFDALFAEAAHNEFAASAMGLMSGLARRMCHLHFQQDDDLPRVARLHAEVAFAAATGDAEAAGQASDALLDYIEGFTRDIVPPPS